MADVDDLFFFGDDFDAVLDLLEAEEDVEEHFIEAVNEVQNRDIACDLCQKKCKSKGGLKRHKTTKHKEIQEGTRGQVEEKLHCDFTVDILVWMVEEVKIKITENKVFSKSLRDELSSYLFISIEEEKEEFCELQKTYINLVKSGNAEKFYSSFYSTICLNSMKYFVGLSRNAATLLSTKVADHMLAYSKKKACKNAPDLDTKLSDKELAGLQYIGGYVLHKLHNKHVNSKIFKTLESQQSVSILKAGKLDNQIAKDSQKLTSSLNRGGLWAITKSAQSIFLKTEHYFRLVTSSPTLHKIDIASIEVKSIPDFDVVSAYNAMLSESELVIDDNVGKDVLQSIVGLYIRVRSFSFAKDIIQKYKMKSKQLKAKALRKEISRSSNDVDKQRQP